MIDPKNTVFVFPGQGSQTVGMGRELAADFTEARTVFEQADAILGFSLSKLMWDGPDSDLNDTINTQPALFVHSMAAYAVLKSDYPQLAPVFMAGHSLGELSALCAAGVFSFVDGLQLVRKRAELMKRAGELNPGGMAAILGVDIPNLEAVCAEASTAEEIVQVANDNSPGQVVISGNKNALERAIAGAKAAGARRALPLAVSIAPHSALMASIQPEWDASVNAAVFGERFATVIGNVNARPLTTVDEVRADVMAQLQSRVRWVESVRFMAGSGVSIFIEVGTGTVLGGLVKRIVEGVTTYPMGNPQDFEILK